jgi:DNA-binding PadR family transcriptional regulator
MPRNRPPSPQTSSVLRALVADPDAWRYGYELGREVGLKAGSLYPILIRLAERELLTGAGRELASTLAPVASRTSAQPRGRHELRNA